MSPVENNKNTVLVIGGVQWLTSAHLHSVHKILQQLVSYKYNYSILINVIKTLLINIIKVILINKIIKIFINIGLNIAFFGADKYINSYL